MSACAPVVTSPEAWQPGSQDRRRRPRLARRPSKFDTSTEPLADVTWVTVTQRHQLNRLPMPLPPQRPASRRRSPGRSGQDHRSARRRAFLLNLGEGYTWEVEISDRTWSAAPRTSRSSTHARAFTKRCSLDDDFERHWRPGLPPDQTAVRHAYYSFTVTRWS